MFTYNPLNETATGNARRSKVKVVAYLDLFFTTGLVFFVIITTVIPLLTSGTVAAEGQIKVEVLEDANTTSPSNFTTGVSPIVVEITQGRQVTVAVVENPMTSLHFWVGILLGILIVFGIVGILAALTLIKAVHYTTTCPDEAGSMTKFWIHCNNAIFITLIVWLPFSVIIHQRHQGPFPVPYLVYFMLRCVFTYIVLANKRYTSPDLQYDLNSRKDIERPDYRPEVPRRRARFESYAFRYKFYEPAILLQPYKGSGVVPTVQCVNGMRD